jgi:hypothetical protein
MSGYSAKPLWAPQPYLPALSFFHSRFDALPPQGHQGSTTAETAYYETTQQRRKMLLPGPLSAPRTGSMPCHYRDALVLSTRRPWLPPCFVYG